MGSIYSLRLVCVNMLQPNLPSFSLVLVFKKHESALAIPLSMNETGLADMQSLSS